MLEDTKQTKIDKKIAAGNAPAAKNICRTKERRQQNE